MYTAYDIFGVPENATGRSISKSWYQLCRRYHPDKCPGRLELMKAINVCYSVLQDHRLRTRYDEVIAMTKATSGAFQLDPVQDPELVLLTPDEIQVHMRQMLADLHFDQAGLFPTYHTLNPKDVEIIDGGKGVTCYEDDDPIFIDYVCLSSDEEDAHVVVDLVSDDEYEDAADDNVDFVSNWKDDPPSAVSKPVEMESQVRTATQTEAIQTVIEKIPVLDMLDHSICDLNNVHETALQHTQVVENADCSIQTNLNPHNHVNVIQTPQSNDNFSPCHAEIASQGDRKIEHLLENKKRKRKAEQKQQTPTPKRLKQSQASEQPANTSTGNHKTSKPKPHKTDPRRNILGRWRFKSNKVKRAAKSVPSYYQRAMYEWREEIVLRKRTVPA